MTAQADTAAALRARLEAGWALCEAEPDPARRVRLDAHWVALLRRYEAACTAQAVMRPAGRAPGRRPPLEDPHHVYRR